MYKILIFSLLSISVHALAMTTCTVSNLNGVYTGQGPTEQYATTDAFRICFDERDGRQDYCGPSHSTVACSDDRDNGNSVACTILTQNGSFVASGPNEAVATASAEGECFEKGGDTVFCNAHPPANCR